MWKIRWVYQNHTHLQNFKLWVFFKWLCIKFCSCSSTKCQNILNTVRFVKYKWNIEELLYSHTEYIIKLWGNKLILHTTYEKTIVRGILNLTFSYFVVDLWRFSETHRWDLYFLTVWYKAWPAGRSSLLAFMNSMAFQSLKNFLMRSTET